MKKLLQRRAYFWISVICLCFGIFWAYKAISCIWEQRTDGFTVASISSSRKPNPAWEVHSLSQDERTELDKALSQKYRYLACGNQAFAFLSEDGRYVLKFFKQKLFEPPFPWKWLPSAWLKEGRRAKKVWKKEDKLRRDFESYRMAFDELKEETGLILVHLNPTDWIGRNISISDKIHLEHSIPLDDFNFIIQRRADLVYPTIDRLMAEGNIIAAKEALSSILNLFASRCQKGIADSDPDLDKNFGFIDGHAVQIDIGRFTRNTAKVKFHDRHLSRQSGLSEVEPPVIKDSFKAWLLESHPALYEQFMNEYQTLCDQNGFKPQSPAL